MGRGRCLNKHQGIREQSDAQKKKGRDTMIKKTISICLALILTLSLTACGHEHQWTPADCTTPDTCLGCGETQGEALGHTWAEEACETAKTCTRCAQTQGEALGHTWLDATYDSPKICTVCAATEGERLMTYFEEYGLEERILGKSGEYQLEQPCAADDTKTTVARIIVEDYKTIPGDETHEALDGYEWKILTLIQRYSDENARKYGGNLGMYLWTGKYASGTPQEDDDHSGLFEGGMPYCVTKDGVDYPDGLLKIREEASD